ncbi:MAG: signal peptidase I [Myxococcales bacterium]|nr:MAG: signal peptidase I [Myxococcales bacterium]
MFDKLTKGKLIAGLIAITIAGFFWNVFFPPGGSGANILLGIFVAVFFIYYFSGYFGSLIDQEIFPGGSKKRARLYRALHNFTVELATQLSNIKKSKSKLRKIGQKPIEDLEQSLSQAQQVMSQIKSQWSQQGSMNDHEHLLKDAHEKLERSSRAVFSLQRKWRFLYGMPSLIFALFCALLIREVIIEPYQIPSGSMIPTLLVGDHLFVSKYYYGLSKPFSSEPDFIIQWRKPKPGDVVVFKAPDYVGRHAGQAWIKRVIATEGQTVQVINNVVYVDGKPYEHVEQAKPVTYMDFFGFGGPDGGVWRKQTALRSIEKIGNIEHQIHIMPFAPSPALGAKWPVASSMSLPGLECSMESCKVKPGFLFVMGDNRGNSADSRIWGALPVARIKGRASFIWMSVDGSEQSVKIGPFNLPKFRFERWFTGIH